MSCEAVPPPLHPKTRNQFQRRRFRRPVSCSGCDGRDMRTMAVARRRAGIVHSVAVVDGVVCAKSATSKFGVSEPNTSIEDVDPNSLSGKRIIVQVVQWSISLIDAVKIRQRRYVLRARCVRDCNFLHPCYIRARADLSRRFFGNPDAESLERGIVIKMNLSSVSGGNSIRGGPRDPQLYRGMLVEHDNVLARNRFSHGSEFWQSLCLL